MKKLLLSLFLVGFWLASTGQGTVTTSPPLTNNNGQSGITFQVSSNTPVNITSLGCIINSGVTTAEIWIRSGGVSASGSPNVSTAGGWVQVATAAPVTGANGTNIATITPASPIAIPANTPTGVYIGAGLSYQTGTSADQVIFTDGTFTINVSDSVAYGGAAPSPGFNPRRFLGSVTYALGVTGNCNAFSNFTIDSISADAAKIDWTPGTSNTGFRLEYGTAGFTPGTGTTVTGTYPSTTQPPVILTGLSANTNYDVYFEEYCNSGNDTVRFPSAQTFSTTKLCAAPTAFTDSNLTSNSVDLGWAQAGTFNESYILYGPSGTPIGGPNWNQDTVASPLTTYTLAGLSPSTAYDIFLVTNCGAVNGFSDTIGPISITTPLQGPQGLTCTTGSSGPVFADDFESQGGWTGDFGAGTTASNWNYNSGGTGSSGTGPNSAHSGTFYLYTETSGTPSGAEISAVSPRIDLTTAFDFAELSFWLHAYGAGIDTIQVRVGTAPSGPFTTLFTQVGQIQSANADPWTNVGVNLDAYVGQNIYLEFRVVHGSGFTGDVAIDLVEVNACQTCPNPGNPSLTFLSSDSASFSWSGGGNQYQINWGPRGFTQGSPTSNFDSTATNSFGLGGLMGNTAYDLYLRNDCSDSANGFSGWVGPFTFVTNCNAFTAPYSNNFDSDSLDAPPICWANYIVGGTSTTAIAAEVEAASTFNPAISSPNYVRMYNFNADTTMLRTPEFSDMPNDSNRISFFARTTTTATTGNEIVVGTIDGADNWSSFDAFDTITLTNVYQQFFVDITAANGYNGTDTYIVLEHAGSTFRTFYIDDFVYEKIPLCNPPLITSMGNSFATATTGDVFWGAGSDGDATRIEWGLQGYTPGSPIGSDTVGGVVDTFLITGLSPQTTYDVYIQDSCSGDGLSPYVGPITIKTACAITSPAVLPIVDGFENYTSGPTFSDVEFFCNPGYYFEFTPGPNNGRARLQAGTGYYNNGSQAFTMDQSSFMSGGATNFLTMTVDLSSYTNSGGIELSFYFMNHGQPVHPDNKVWVRGAAGDSWIEILDLNLLSSGTGTYDSVQGVDILAPITANGQSIGTNTQIRFGQHGTTLSSSVSFSDGYTFDDISLEAVSCAKPSGLAAANLIDTAATLSWNASQSASQTQYWFGPGGFFQGTLTAGGVQAFTSGSSVLVDTLSPETCYEFLVRNVCAPGDTSDWAGPFLFCTPCAAISANYYENFDGLTAGLDLGCFNKIEDPALAQSAFQGVVINTSSFNQAFTPPSVVELDNSNLTSSTLALVSPLTNDLDDGNKRLRFRARSTSTFNTRELHIGTTNDPASGVVNRFDTVTLTTSMDEYIVELTPANGYNGTDMYFVIEHGNLSTFQTIYVDDVNYERIPTCFRPSGVQVSSITSTSASVSWTAAGSGTNFQIEYGINPLGDPNNTRVLNTGTTASLASLIPGTGYCVWVREICTPGDTSFWEGPICFSTLCPTSYSAPYFTNFENISIGTGSGSPAGWDNCWTTTSTSGLRWESEDASGANENSLNTGPFFDNTLNGTPGGTYMYLETSFGGTSEDLISPGIDIATVSNPELEFHYHMFGATINKLIVYAEDANGNRTNLDSIGGQQQVAGSDSFRVRTVSLAGLTPGVYNFIFEGHRGTSFTGDIAIDDVSVQAGASCPAPNNLRQTAATLSSIDVAWNAPASATSWEIEYGPVGFSQGAGTIVAVTTNPYTITGLSSATSYDFYVREICTPGDTSTWAGPATVATDLCSPSSQCMYALQLDDTFGDGWNGAEIKVLQNNVEVGTFGSTFTTGSQFIDSVALCNGLATSIVLDPAGSWPSEIGVTVIDRFGVPIDSFVAGGLAPTTGDTLISFTPICGFPCASPTGISVTNNVGCDSVEVDWTSNSGGSLIEYGVSGFTPGTGTLTGIVTPPYTITGLSPNTAYDIWIADTCTNDTSTFEQLTATTASGPMPVAAFTIDSAIVNGAYQIYVDASPSVAADNYQWTFGNGITSSTIADTVSYATNGSYTITLIVTNACGSDTATFVTNANVGLVDNQLAGSLNVYPNPADDLVNLSFSVVGSAQAEIRILDMQGREVWRATETAQGARFNAQVDVSEFAAGVYMVEINSAGIQARRRVSIR